MNKVFKKYLLIVFVMLSFVFSSNIANAAFVNCGRSANDPCTISDLFGSSSAQSNPIWIDLIQTALGISGIIILCIFIYAGFKLMISGGEQGKIKKAREMMVGSFVGILLVFFSFTIVKAGLIILVGNKWGIYFGNSEISSTSNTTTNTTTNTTPGGCSSDSNCRDYEYCCNNNRYNPSNVSCANTTGTCFSKKIGFLRCKDNVECKSNDCSLTYCFDKVNPSTYLKNNSNLDIENGDPCGSSNGRCMYIKTELLTTFNSSGLMLDSNVCTGSTDSNTVNLICIKKENYK